MSNPNTFIDSYSQNIVQFVRLAEVLRLQNDQLVQDPTLITRYFNQATPPPATIGVPIRTDIVAADVNAAHDAMVQILFAFDSGNPPQKAALYKMLP